MGTRVDQGKAGRREWAGLAVLALPALLVSLDTFVMLMAMPRLSTDLGASGTQQLWILDVYGFMVAGFLVTMGTLGDRIGRRRLLLAGSAAFGAASVFAAYSTSPEMLIAARALLGVAGATISPSTLALIMNLFHDPRQRATAIGIWAGCFTVGAIIGPLVGGVMLEHFWWGSVFLLGVPAMALLLVLGPVLLPEFRNPDAGRLDLPSLGLSLAGILPFVYGLKDLARSGPRAVSVGAVVVGLAVGAVFLRRQARIADPLVDLALFRSRGFSPTLGGMLAYSMFSGGTMAFLAQQLQLVEGLSPLRVGAAMVPGMVAAIVSFQISPALARRARPAVLFAAGLSISIAGLLIVSQAADTRTLAIGFAVASFGGGPLVSLGTTLVVGATVPEKAGAAAGLAQTGNEFGYALGVAVLGSLGTVIYRSRLHGHVPAQAYGSIEGATTAAAHLSGPASAHLLHIAHAAFTAELHTIAAVSAAGLVVIATLLATRLRHLPPLGPASPDAAEPSQALEPAEV